MDKVLERMDWSKPFDRSGNGQIKRGRGFAIANKAVISPTTSVAIVNVSADGSATLYCGTVDMGQGSDTAMAQMVAEILNIPTEDVRVTPRDTDVTPYDMGTLGSRSLFHMGHAVRRAAEDARDKLKALAKEVGEPEGSNIPIAELFQKRYGMQAGNVIGSGIYKPDYAPPAPGTGQSPNVTPFWMIAGAGAEVEVDTETGHVKITKLINVVDCGKAINPKSVETQISGAALMHLGFTMFEKMHIDGGQVTNASLADYKIPGFHDVPEQLREHLCRARPVERPVRRQGRRRGRDLLRRPGDRQRHRRRGRRPADGNAAQRRDGVSRVTRQAGQAAGGRLTWPRHAPSPSSSTARRSTADVKPHHNLVELLQTHFGLTGARESCGQGLCGCCTVSSTAARCRPASISRNSSTAPRSPPSRAWTRPTSSARCRRRSSRPAPSSAATARRASS